MSVGALCDLVSNDISKFLINRVRKFGVFRSFLSMLTFSLHASLFIPTQMSDTRTLLKDGVPQSDECNPSQVSSTWSITKQLMDLRTKALQAHSQMATGLQQVHSAQIMAFLDSHNNVGSINPVTSTTSAIPTVNLEELVKIQSLILQQVSQLTTLIHQALGSQVVAYKGATEVQLDESQRGAHPQHHAMDCHCCEFYGVPCRRVSANRDDEATTKRNQMLFSGRKRKISPQEQLSGNSLLRNALSVGDLELIHGELHPNNSKKTLLGKDLPPAFLDGWTITCHEFQAQKYRRSKKKANKEMEAALQPSKHQLNGIPYTSPSSQQDFLPGHDKFKGQHNSKVSISLNSLVQNWQPIPRQFRRYPQPRPAQ